MTIVETHAGPPTVRKLVGKYRKDELARLYIDLLDERDRLLNRFDTLQYELNLYRGATTMNPTCLGKITHAAFGFGGRDDQQFGLSVTLECGHGTVNDFIGFWGPQITIREGTQWTERDRSTHYANTMYRVANMLEKANRLDVAGLKGIPVEIEFEGNMLKEWRVLTEVL